MDIKAIILRLVADDQIKEAIDALLKYAVTERYRQDVMVISGRYRIFLLDLQSGRIAPPEYNQRRTEIINEIIDLAGRTISQKPPFIPARPANKDYESAEGAESSGSSRGDHHYEDDDYDDVESAPEAPATDYEGLEGLEGLESEEKEVLPPNQRIVNTGFAPKDTPQFPSPDDVTLVAGQSYFFWLEVGELLKDTIEVRPASLPTEHLPDEAELEVALYAMGDGFQIEESASIGKLKLNKNGVVRVSQQPMYPPQLAVSAEMFEKRLFFPVQAAAKEGRGLLKCNIYCQGILVQSREVRAEIAAQTKPLIAALTSELQYSLASTLTAKQLNAYREHKLSVLLSESDQESHSLQIFGSHQYKKDASFDEGTISNTLREIRGGLRLAAWGKETEYQNEPYLYESKAKNLDQLSAHLFMLAKRGYNFYDALVNSFAGPGRAARKALEELMREPGYVQLVLQKGARQVLPLAVLYDHPLDAGVPSVKSYRLCDNFRTALEQNQPLAECSCFQGNCPHREDRLVVCPSGFWGYRHYLGMPHSVKDSPFAPAEIFYSDKPEVAVASWTDVDFKYRVNHINNLKAWNNINWKFAEDRKSTINLLKDKQLSMVYFYCHGGMSNSFPYLLVGKDRNELIVPSLIRSEDIFWEDSHPLVFINGCHTTSLSPEQTLNFVSAFVENALCAGVIGTEITIFEQLAVDFSTAFFKRFTNNVPVGKAIRDARLDILQQYNPLGLVYIPFVISGLQLVKK